MAESGGWFFDMSDTTKQLQLVLHGTSALGAAFTFRYPTLQRVAHTLPKDPKCEFPRTSFSRLDYTMFASVANGSDAVASAGENEDRSV